MPVLLPHPDRPATCNAARLAFFAAAAYPSAGELREELRHACLDHGWAHDYSQTGAAEVLAVRGEHATVIAIGGSNERADWIGNLSKTPVRLEEYARQNGYTPAIEGSWRVHRGFLIHADRVLRKLQQLSFDPLDFGLFDRQPVYVTGHSQGGAAAVLAHCLSKDMAHAVQQIVTFGAPRVFFGKAPKMPEQLAIERCVDLAPSRPCSFLHAEGRQRRLLDVNGALVSGASMLDRLAAGGYWLTNIGGLAGAVWAGHSMNAYRRGLEQWV